MTVVEFSPNPKDLKEDIESYEFKSEEDRTLFETGMLLLNRFLEGKFYKTADGRKIPLPIKTEGWPGDTWFDGKNSNVNRLWGRTLSEAPYSLSKIALTKFYDLRAKECYVRLDTREHQFRASHVRERGIDWIKKKVEVELGLDKSYIPNLGTLFN